MKNIILSIVVAASILFAVTRSDGQPAPAPAKHQQWEYGTLINRPGMLCAWNTGKAETFGASLEEVYTKLGGKPAKEVHGTVLMDLLGSQGWELVADNVNGTIASQTFKRPVR